MNEYEEFTSQTLNQLGIRIKQLRLKSGYSNADIFAYEHGISRSQYGRYERGEDIRFSTLTRLIKAFKISLQEFFAEGFE